MRRAVVVTRRISRFAIVAAGVVTGCLMAGLGVAVRLSDALPGGGLAAWFGTAFFTGMGWTAGRIGWALVLEGTFWVAAMAAWGTRNRWGWWTAAMAATISLAFAPGGTAAGVFVLAMMVPFLLREQPWKVLNRMSVERG